MYHVWLILDSGASLVEEDFTYREAIVFLETSKYLGMILDSSGNMVYTKTGKGIRIKEALDVPPLYEGE